MTEEQGERCQSLTEAWKHLEAHHLKEQNEKHLEGYYLKKRQEKCLEANHLKQRSARARCRREATTSSRGNISRGGMYLRQIKERAGEPGQKKAPGGKT